MVAAIPAAARPLLNVHLEDLDAQLKPGAYVLTWVSLNIDGYLHNLHQVCSADSAKSACMRLNSKPPCHLLSESCWTRPCSSLPSHRDMSCSTAHRAGCCCQHRQQASSAWCGSCLPGVALA